jgi:secondary thiamine-phosphate synthase enzyme
VTQKILKLSPYRRGFHIITDEIISCVGELPHTGLIHVFIQHTSAGITINENADPDVLVDFEGFMNRIVPENQPFLRHTIEGSDDMPAHVKASLVGSSISIPISEGRLNLGTWQGIYLCEFRNHGGRRRIVITICS